MSITLKNHWMFVATVTGTLMLTACSPPPHTPENESTAPVTVRPENPQVVKSIDALTGLKIIQFGPTSARAHSASGERPEERMDVWAQADRKLDGYEAALWLDGKRLENHAVDGITVTGSIPASVLTSKGTFALEIRIGEDGSKLSSQKVDFVVE